MRMLSGEIDVFYIDESRDQNLYVATAVAAPLIHPVDGGTEIR